MIQLLTNNVMWHTIIMMIKSFACKETQKIFNREYSKRSF